MRRSLTLCGCGAGAPKFRDVLASWALDCQTSVQPFCQLLAALCAADILHFHFAQAFFIESKSSGRLDPALIRVTGLAWLAGVVSVLGACHGVAAPWQVARLFSDLALLIVEGRGLPLNPSVLNENPRTGKQLGRIADDQNPAVRQCHQRRVVGTRLVSELPMRQITGG